MAGTGTVAVVRLEYVHGAKNQSAEADIENTQNEDLEVLDSYPSLIALFILPSRQMCPPSFHYIHLRIPIQSSQLIPKDVYFAIGPQLLVASNADV